MQNPCVPAVELANLTQRFGARLAVDRLSLSIPPGMFYGIVGPNGAGKTTALTAMCGLRRPTAGSVRVVGHDLRTSREAALAQLGVMMDGLSLPERLTAGEVLRYSAGLRGLDDGWRSRAGDLLEILGLDAVPRTLIVEYSTGMRKKISLALALLHRSQYSYWTSRSRRSTRSRPAPSSKCSRSTSTLAAQWSCRATSWNSSSATATGWQW
ncbi:ABC transporter ATP-binding protein [Streptomyces ardesiacus]|uniref:ABC transporter ATP-binding protein n=1 Tax=Streptomyces ardesiacus TaxID=285564 RepID=UPI00380413C2